MGRLAQAQLHFPDNQQRAFGISNLSYWSSVADKAITQSVIIGVLGNISVVPYYYGN